MRQVQDIKMKLFLTLVLFLGVCFVAATWGPTVDSKGNSVIWFAILPPLLAITLAFVTQKLRLSLILAILAGGVLETTGLFSGAKKGVEHVYTAASDSWNLQVLAFIVLVLTLISVVVSAGGFQALIQVLERYAKNRRSSMLVTALLGVLIFIDDYANTMIVGTSTRSLNDRFRVSREKFAFIVDATSAPIAGIAIISTWIGYQVGLFGKSAEDLNMGVDGYTIFFDSWPFHFYCILMIIFVFTSILFDSDFGPMKRAERRARDTGKLLKDGARPVTSHALSESKPCTEARPSLWVALFPLGLLFLSLFLGLWLDGGGGRRPYSDLLSFDAWRVVISASENNVTVLAQAAILGLVVALVLAKWAARMTWKSLALALKNGLLAGVLPVTILILAWALKAACDGVGTSQFLVAAVGESMSPVLFPVVVFLLGGITAFATGTSWGTMAILIPTVAPIAFELDQGTYGWVTIISLGAILDGAILGDHCSPISDTTLMSSIATSCDHMDHVQTQMPYALFVGALAVFCGYLPAGLGYSPWLSLGIGAAVIVGLLSRFRNGSTSSVSSINLKSDD